MLKMPIVTFFWITLYYSKNEIILLSRVHFKSKDLGGMVERITFLMLLLWEKNKKKKKEMVEGKKDREREINVARSIFLFCDEKVSDLQEEEKKTMLKRQASL